MPYLKDQCSRCWVGVDDDHDGNCNVCIRLDNISVVKMRNAQRLNIQKVSDITRQGTFEEVRMYLAATKETNPLLAIDAYRQRYPRMGDLDAERYAEERKQLPTTLLGYPVVIDPNQPEGLNTVKFRSFAGIVLEFVDKKQEAKG